MQKKKGSQITLQNFGNFKSSNDKGALSPIYQALHLNFANDFLGKIVITEGITDYYMLSILQRYTSNIDDQIKIIPSSGASQSSTLLSIAIPFSDNFVLLLDNDQAGKSAQKKYLREFGDFLKDKIHLYNSTKPKFVLEDYLCEEDTIRLQELTNSNDVKRCLGFLFYDYKDKQEDFVNKLSRSTLKNLEDVFQRIKLL